MPEGLEPILVLAIEADHPLRADQISQIIERLGTQFESFQRRQRVKVGFGALRLQDIRTGSLFAKLIAVADAVNTLAENSDVVKLLQETLAGFYAQLFDAFQYLSGEPGSRPSAHNKRTIEILAAPVARDNASQISLQLYGDNNRVILITPEVAETLMSERALEAKILSEPLAEESVRDRAVIEDIDERLTALRAADKLGPGAAEWVVSQRHGTLLSVWGEWYVRYEGGGGVLVPLRDGKSDTSALDAERQYVVEGQLLRDGSRVTGFTADTIIDPASGNSY